ncbi:glutamate racemase [Abditibacterium utsteinense]|uniref:Glutamate racemase n=1 Tax=Abditibacterium utsteinense TaxID=1960156 RepID=A0A2S8SQS6_9BACT|nr:glutamate racemase [Abditibacterium utsteinense]PQV63099.1 glutamate racemase [Abditibacterium utsteinense]
MNAPKIGIRDSGVGGLTVARRIKEQVPNADLLYFADTAHVPYGEKSVVQIRHYALSISAFLIEQGAQMVVFACNTTSALALEAARARFEVPVFGVIEPGARGAAQVSRGKVGVLATAATVASGVYSREIRQLWPDLQTLEVACPAFVPLVEAQQTESLQAFEACQNYLQPLLDFGADTVVLGCTHYPLLLAHLQQIAPHIQFIDPADALARQVAAHLAATSAQSTKNEVNSTKNQGARDTFWVSGARDGVEDWVQTLLDNPNPHLEIGPVFDL